MRVRIDGEVTDGTKLYIRKPVAGEPACLTVDAAAAHPLCRDPVAFARYEGGCIVINLTPKGQDIINA